MARDETDREDLLREAVALVRRAEFAFGGGSEPVLAGFKRDGSLSVYFGADPVYQFNPRGQLRRAYVDGFLYRTQGRTLARLERTRTDRKTILQRHDLTPEELDGFLSRMRPDLDQLQERLSARHYDAVKQIPSDVDLAPAILDAIERVLSAEPALAPPIPGRR